MHAVWPEKQKWLTNNTSGGSKNWLETHLHRNIDDAVVAMREHNPKIQILATHLSEDAIDFREVDYTKPTAIIVGQEKTGISEKALEYADQKYYYSNARYGAIIKCLGCSCTYII